MIFVNNSSFVVVGAIEITLYEADSRSLFKGRRTILIAGTLLCDRDSTKPKTRWSVLSFGFSIIFEESVQSIRGTWELF